MKRRVAFLLALVLAAAAVCLFLSRTWMWADVPRVVTGTLNTGPVIKRFSLSAQLEANGGVDVVPDRNLSYSLIVEEVCARGGGGCSTTSPAALCAGKGTDAGASGCGADDGTSSPLRAAGTAGDRSEL